MMILVRVAERDDAKTAPVAIHGRQQQFSLFLRASDDPEFFQRKTGIHFSWFADLILFTKKVSGGKWSGMEESLRFAAAGLALPAPANDALAGRAEALEKNVAVLVWKIEFARLLQGVR